jgi:hypothetical protein
MTPEQAMALAQDSSPVYVAGAFEVIAAAYLDEPKATDAFRSGRGIGWHEHHECLFRGTERPLPQRLLCVPCAELDTGARRRGREARARRQGGRRRLRPWRLDRTDGQGLSQQQLRRLRLSRAVDPARPRRRPLGRRRRQYPLRSGEGQDLPGQRLRSHRLLRTTWATRRAPPPISAGPSNPTARSCWWSRSRATRWRGAEQSSS